MLADPLFVNVAVPNPNPTLTGNANVLDTITFRTVSPGDGSSKRIGMLGSAKAELTIQHSPSNENAPFPTLRTNVRINLKKINAETGKEVQMSGYYVGASPQGPDFTDADAVQLAQIIGMLLVFGRAETGTSHTFAIGDDTVTRILAGEP